MENRKIIIVMLIVMVLFALVSILFRKSNMPLIKNSGEDTSANYCRCVFNFQN